MLNLEVTDVQICKLQLNFTHATYLYQASLRTDTFISNMNHEFITAYLENVKEN